MKSSIAAAVMVGSIATLGPAAAAGQAAWEESTFPGGMQFHLRNAEGAAIVLECVDQGIRVGFAFAAPLLATERVALRAVPGERLYAGVTRVDERAIRVEGHRGLDFVLKTLRTKARILVRASNHRASFDIFGSEVVVQQCLRQPDVFGQPGPAISEDAGRAKG